jgi:TPR repeat protein
MRLVFLPVVLVIPIIACAEKASRDVQDLGLFKAARDPFRKIDGAVYDVRSKIAYLTNYANIEPLPEWRPLVGEVIQITENAGMIIDVFELPNWKGEARVVRLLNYPSQDVLVDRKYVACLAKRCGRYQYTNTRGAVSTVESWDYGTIPSRDEITAFIERDKLQAALREARIAQARQRLAEQNAKQNAERDRKILAFQKQRAAEGSAISQYDLALRYQAGDGVEKDEAEALRLLKLSADQGHKRAQEKLRALPSPAGNP